MAANDRHCRSREKTRVDASNEPAFDSGADERLIDGFDDMFAVLSNRYRRYALYHLADRSITDLDAVLDHIVAREAERSGRVDRGELIRRLRIEFHHRHLPMLADVGLVAYDERDGTLVYRERPAFERLLRTARRNEPVAHE